MGNMKHFFEEFKQFISKGNVMDLAVGVIIGGAFTSIVNSLTSDIIMPIVSIFTGGINFEDMKLQIPIGAGEAYFAYGSFINAVIQFLIIALVVFLLVKAVNKLRSLGPGEQTSAPQCPYCKEEIPEGATRCPFCTAELNEPAKPQKAS